LSQYDRFGGRELGVRAKEGEARGVIGCAQIDLSTGMTAIAVALRS
jgi:hypothetical protein